MYCVHNILIVKLIGLVQSRHAHLSGVQSLKNYEEEKIVIGRASWDMDPKAACSLILGWLMGALY